MKIVLAPDSFKGALSSMEAVAAMWAGVERTGLVDEADCGVVPMSDGGEGFCTAMTLALGGDLVEVEVSGPAVLDGQRVRCEVGVVAARDGEPATGVVELAAASGLPLAVAHDGADALDPRRYGTQGTGEAIRALLDRGVGRVLLGIGGSATIDGGCGIAEALGAVFKDGDGLVEPVTGGALAGLVDVDVSGLDERLPGVELAVFNDVTNPLLGRSGSVAVYGEQKGATGAVAEELEAGLAKVSRLWAEQLGQAVSELPGAGAAGGVGGGLVAMLGASLVPGAETVLEALRFDEAVAGADLVLTGEGRLDGQSLLGKAALRVSQRAAAAGVPTVALVGSTGTGAKSCLASEGCAGGLAGVEVIGPGLAESESVARCAELLADAAERVVRHWAGR